MKFLLLKNTGDKYSQIDYYNLSDYVNSLSRFLSISPKEFMEKIEFPEGMTYIRGQTHDLFNINIDYSRTVDKIIDTFSRKFKELVHENNHRMPLHYKIMDKIIGGYSDRKINDLATLRFWYFGN